MKGFRDLSRVAGAGIHNQVGRIDRAVEDLFMDTSKLIEDEFTAEWVKDIIQKLSPYPYLADLFVIVNRRVCTEPMLVWRCILVATT